MDLHPTLVDAGAAAALLRHSPPGPKRLRLSENTNGDDAVPEWDCPAPYEQWLDYSAYENRFRSPIVPASRQDSPDESDEHSPADEGDDDDEVVELRKPTASIPSFFHPSMIN